MLELLYIGNNPEAIEAIGDMSDKFNLTQAVNGLKALSLLKGDYKTDAMLRQAIRDNYQDTTIILIAQRISSIMQSDHILVLDDGEMLGYGTHEELLESCEVYHEIYESQMGSME